MRSIQKNSMPLVSVCIPTYNGERFISEAIRSVLKQTYTNIELIVSDDSSKDKTLSIIKSKLRKSPFPCTIVQHEPKGIGANWNNCIHLAKGKYIKFLFQDDTLEADCIEKMMALAEKDDQLGLVFCKRNFLYREKNDFFDDWIKNYSDVHLHWTGLMAINSGKKLLRTCRTFLNSPLNKVGEPPAVLLRKDIFAKTGYFNEELVQVLDYEFWYRVFKHYKIGFVDEYLVNFRLHNEQTTQKNIGNRNDYALYRKLVLRNLFRYLHPRAKAKLLLQYLRLFPALLRIVKYISEIHHFH